MGLKCRLTGIERHRCKGKRSQIEGICNTSTEYFPRQVSRRESAGWGRFLDKIFEVTVLYDDELLRTTS